VIDAFENHKNRSNELKFKLQFFNPVNIADAVKQSV